LLANKEEMKTTFDAFDDYRDKMNKLANAHEAEAFYLDIVSNECRSVASECQTVADLVSKTTEVLNDVKDSLIPNEGLN
jgi:uncharacterized coiled-coil DUF342 family protein